MLDFALDHRLPVRTYSAKSSNDPAFAQMAGMRDKLIHEYFGVDHQVLWKTAQEDIPSVRRLIATVIKKESGKTRQQR